MKILTSFLCSVLTFVCYAQTDTMIVRQTNGSVLLYPVADIRKLTFGPVVTDIKELESLGKIMGSFALRQNYPNPFNPSTVIEYELPSTGNVKVDIFDVRGSRVCTVRDAQEDAGIHKAVWNGRGSSGRPVASGMYVCQVQFNGTTLHSKLLLLK